MEPCKPDASLRLNLGRKHGFILLYSVVAVQAADIQGRIRLLSHRNAAPKRELLTAKKTWQVCWTRPSAPLICIRWGSVSQLAGEFLNVGKLA